MEEKRQNHSTHKPYIEVLPEFLQVFEIEKKILMPDEIFRIEYWLTKELQIWETGHYKSGYDLLGQIVSTIFNVSFFVRGQKSEDMEYLIAKSSPAFLKHIRHIDICPIGVGIYNTPQWDKVPNNISCLTGVTHMVLAGSNVSNIDNLYGMNLHFLDISGSCKISNLEVVKEMPLAALRIMGTTISDLSVIKNSKTLSVVWATKTPVEKKSIEFLDSVEFLRDAILEGTKIENFPSKISKTSHTKNGVYLDPNLTTPTSAIGIDRNFWFAAHL